MKMNTKARHVTKPHNKALQSEQTTRYARGLAVERERYVSPG